MTIENSFQVKNWKEETTKPKKLNPHPYKYFYILLCQKSAPTSRWNLKSHWKQRKRKSRQDKHTQGMLLHFGPVEVIYDFHRVKRWFIFSYWLKINRPRNNLLMMNSVALLSFKENLTTNKKWPGNFFLSNVFFQNMFERHSRSLSDLTSLFLLHPFKSSFSFPFHFLLPSLSPLSIPFSYAV